MTSVLDYSDGIVSLILERFRWRLTNPKQAIPSHLEWSKNHFHVTIPDYMYCDDAADMYRAINNIEDVLRRWYEAESLHGAPRITFPNGAIFNSLEALQYFADNGVDMNFPHLDKTVLEYLDDSQRDRWALEPRQATLFNFLIAHGYSNFDFKDPMMTLWKWWLNFMYISYDLVTVDEMVTEFVSFDSTLRTIGYKERREFPPTQRVNVILKTCNRRKKEILLYLMLGDGSDPNTWFADWELSEGFVEYMRDTPLLQLMVNSRHRQRTTPLSLQECARNEVRRSVGARCFQRGISNLPLPSSLKQYCLVTMVCSASIYIDICISSIASYVCLLYISCSRGKDVQLAT